MNNNMPLSNNPFKITLEAGKTYAWCTCGKSSNQPFCDGAHRNTEMKPLVFTAETSKTAFLCGCKTSQNAPFCDGSHSKINR